MLDEFLWSSSLCVARDFTQTSQPIIGMGTIAEIVHLDRTVAMIEDVVIDELYRGKGVGRQICTMLMNSARDRGCTEIRLTSRASREQAHALYLSLGFQRVETQVFSLRM